mgnify:CR=1 FL=1
MPRRQRLPKEPIEADIIKLNHEGRGIAQVNGGKVTFIRDALPGEKVCFKLMRKHGQFDEGAVESIIVPAPERIPAKCRAYSRCGGCSFQHVSTEYQINHKQSVLQELLTQAGLSPARWLEPITAEPWGYRCKARLAVRHVAKKDGVLVGFRETNGRFLTDMQRCEVLHPAIGDKIQDLREWLDQLSIKDQIPQIEVAIGDDHIALVIRHLQPFTAQDLKIVATFAEQHQFWIYLQPKGLESVRLFYPEQTHDLISYQLPDYDLQIAFHPTDFTQVNPTINRKMIQRALSLLDPQADERILDLFCGLGNFTLPLARSAGEVIGVEGDQRMVDRAKYNADRNHIQNIEFYAANLFEPAQKQRWWPYAYDKLLLDPPRAGAKEIIEQLSNKKFKKIVYVSCNPTTLVRDAVILSAQGYKLETVGVMDMFPHTAHVESIACLAPST